MLSFLNVQRPALGLLVAVGLLAGCIGTVDSPLKMLPPGMAELPPGVIDYGLVVSGSRRLSRSEIDASLSLLTQDSRGLGQLYLPPDQLTPFDNDSTVQVASLGFVEAAERVALETVTATLADPARRASALGCQPTGPSDAACFRSFIERFGRRALKRPLASAEVDELMALQALGQEDGKFESGASAVMQVLLQDGEFLYRIEQGTPVEGRTNLVAVSSLEMASRLSFLLWGSAPPDWLLDDGEAGRLQTPEQLTVAAQRLLLDPRAHRQVERFHALWLGYQQLPHAPALSTALLTETNALVTKVIFQDQASYARLFDSPSTYIDASLASHYGLAGFSAASGWQWVDYGASPGRRKGILSHGAVLSRGAKFGDTSPTQRGKFIRENLLCQTIPKPMGVNTDEKPTGGTSNCKPDRYSNHGSGGCVDCHTFMDPVGFGLEGFDSAGVFRTVEKDEPTCKVAGDGVLNERNGNSRTFNGPDQLSELLIQTGELENCVTQQLFHFATGRSSTGDDAGWVAELVTQFKAQNRSFTQLLVAIASHKNFTQRRPEEI